MGTKLRTGLIFLALGILAASLCRASFGQGSREGGDDSLKEARSIVVGLGIEERAAQLLLIGVGGRGRAIDESLALVEGLGPGGILLFGFNVPDRPEELGEALGRLQDAAGRSRAGLPLIVAIDHEGGGVFRFRGGVTRPPPPLETALRGSAYARILGEREGLELSALGINFVLGPVVERLTDSNKGFLGNRSYGADPLRVDATAGAYIEGLGAARVASAAKHFPGNGLVDPHRGLPRIELDEAAFVTEYLPRFSSAMAHGVPAIMLSHVLVPAIDPLRPATLSPALVDGLLRGKLGFEGLVLTDDLLMKALNREPERSAPEAIAAGADLLMLSAGEFGSRVRDALVAAVQHGSLSASRLEEAAVRVVALKLRFGMKAFLDSAERERHIRALPGLVAESAQLLEAAIKRSR